MVNSKLFPKIDRSKFADIYIYSLRRTHMWWITSPLSNVHGSRQHVAQLFMHVALAIATISYIAPLFLSFMAIFMHEAWKGNNVDQLTSYEPQGRLYGLY